MKEESKIKLVVSVLFLVLAFAVLLMGKVYAQTNYPTPMTVSYNSDR